MNFRRLNIISRSFYCFSLLAGLMLMIGLFGLNQFYKIRDYGLKIEMSIIPRIFEANNFIILITRNRSEVVRMIALPDAETRATSLNKIRRIEQQFEAGFSHYNMLIDSNREQQTFDSLSIAYSDYQLQIKKLTSFLDTGEIDKARNLIKGDIAVLDALINKLAESLVETNRNSIKESKIESKNNYLDTIIKTEFFILSALCAAALIYWRFMNSIIQPISTAVIAAQKLADGDFEQALDTSGTDEVSQILRSMQKIQKYLNNCKKH